MRPTRVSGLTDADRARQCTGKHRWPDELSARAAALHAIETYRNASALWVYHCPHCRGWHLTRRWHHSPPAASLPRHDMEATAP